MDSLTAAKQIRELSLRLVHKARASHIASALSISDLLGVFVANPKILNLQSIFDPNRDRLLLSKGHACVALYSALYIKGFFEESDLFTYGEDFSIFMNHASHYVPGVEFSTGALGHALPVSCGKALACKLKGETWHTFVVMSDGELQEGSNWEAILFANQFRLNNLTICIDYNNMQSLTSVDNTISLQPLAAKLESFGWKVFELDGHNHDDIHCALLESKSQIVPCALILKTIKGKGVSFMESSIDWHYKSPSDFELEMALKELNAL